MNCMCGVPIGGAQKFCIECGRPVVVRCANGHALEREQKYCIECGLPCEDSGAPIAKQPKSPWSKPQMGFTKPIPLVESSNTSFEGPRAGLGWPKILLICTTWIVGAICCTLPLTQTSVSFAFSPVPLQLHWFHFAWFFWVLSMVLAVISRRIVFSVLGLMAGAVSLFTLIDQLSIARNNAISMVTPRGAYFVLVLTVVAAIGGSFWQFIVGVVRRRKG